MASKVIPRRNNKVKRDDEVIEIGEYGSFVRGVDITLIWKIQ
jgi:hypothetical protein